MLVEEGKVLAEGTHESLVATSARYRQVLSLEHFEGRAERPEPDDAQPLGTQTLDIGPGRPLA